MREAKSQPVTNAGQTATDGRELFHQMLTNRPNPARAYKVLNALATAASSNTTTEDRPQTNLRALAAQIYDTGNPERVLSSLRVLLTAAMQEGGEDS